MKPANRPQVKICGLTNPAQAAQCAELGADAIGCVFFDRSPRNVSDDQAKAIREALPPGVATVGVFVDEPMSAIMSRVETCGLRAVQLHGVESPELVKRLRAEGLIVIKGIFLTHAPGLADAERYPDVSAFLVECGKGPLPGGNAQAWNWADARTLGEKYPLVLAGGLTPKNLAQAIAEAQPDVVDVSSGVESAPGQKDMDKVRAFMESLSHSHVDRQTRRIF
jgi:phosphoribosylanthranilate isomerase/indole-3-glycerol phosphate synthase/phosphoribosylanthranilate isomerase